MKLRRLKELLSSSSTPATSKTKDQPLCLTTKKRIVMFTGAGISTTAGIPDFRGPQGIWTVEKLQKKKKKRKRGSQDSTTKKTNSSTGATMDFASAEPTLTHRAITRLIVDGHVAFCVTQNVDGLHRRSGLSRAFHSVLHGCVFTEQCQDCHTEYFRNFEVGGMSFQPTGRKCDECGGALCDTLLDWEDPLPEADLDRSYAYCREADLVICLGTSLRIQPAGLMPTLAKQFVIVNLQKTPEDKNAALIIHERVDKVILAIMEHFGYGQDWRETEILPIEYIWQPPKAGQESV